MMQEVNVSNGVFDFRTPLECVGGFRRSEAPYSWLWDAQIRPNGDSIVVVTEVNLIKGGRKQAAVVHYKATDIVAELRAHWNRPALAHCVAEGRLGRKIDVLRRELSELYVVEYSQIMARARSAYLRRSGTSADDAPNRVIDPPQGLIDAHTVRDDRGVMTIETYYTGQHREKVHEIAWGLTLLAAFKQGCQYDLPYGGKVFDVAHMLHTAPNI